MEINSMEIKLKRAYEPHSDTDGFRILVDRLWPRGLSKEKLKIDLWLKDIAPSNELRKWFGHEPPKWDEFRKRYEDELLRKPEAVSELRNALAGRTEVTFVYGAKDEVHNQAVVLREFVLSGRFF